MEPNISFCQPLTVFYGKKLEFERFVNVVGDCVFRKMKIHPWVLQLARHPRWFRRIPEIIGIRGCEREDVKRKFTNGLGCFKPRLPRRERLSVDRSNYEIRVKGKDGNGHSLANLSPEGFFFFLFLRRISLRENQIGRRKKTLDRIPALHQPGIIFIVRPCPCAMFSLLKNITKSWIFIYILITFCK